MGTNEIVEVNGNEVTVTDNEEYILELSKTYHFEEEEVSSLDFSGLENITANNMIRAGKIMMASGAPSVFPENDLYYLLIIASDATGMPIEFFKALAPRDALKVKNKVSGFFFGEE